jgi:hypothetical protein
MMLRSDIDLVKLSAYISADLTIRSLGTDQGKPGVPSTFGEIAAETVLRVEISCMNGTLGLDVASWERDPEDG